MQSDKPRIQRWTALGRVAAVVLIVSGGTALAQLERRPDQAPGDRPPDQQAQPEGERPDGLQLSPERFRARLASLLEQLDASAVRLRGAIETLDGGGSVEDVMAPRGGPVRVGRLADMWGQWGGPGERSMPDRPGAGPGVGPGAGQGAEGGWQGEAGRGPWEAREAGVEEIMTFLREHAPEIAERLRQLREEEQAGGEDPRRAEGFILRFSSRVSEILAAREHDPELAELLTRDFRLGMRLLEAGSRYARALGAGEAEQAEQAKAELRELAAAQVDLKLERREHEIAMLAKRLEELQGEVEDQRTNREQLIDELVEQAGRGRFRGGPGGDRRGPPEGAGRRDRRGQPGG